MAAPQASQWQSGKRQTAFPTRQLFVLALCRICEPIAFMSIFPYVYYMVSSFHITDDEKKIALYAGMVTSAFAFAEFSTGVVWGRLSDKFGRKPILLMGLAGTGISMLAFGFAPNLTSALIARALGGLLNGNIGVLQTTVAEVVTVEAHQARAYSIMPFVWCLGSIIGSGLGGTLADPVRNYPGYFSEDSIFATYPYLLPNIVCTGVVVFGMVVGILFLEETHEDKKERKDIGLEAGKWLLGLIRPARGSEKIGFGEESLNLLADSPPGYSSQESSPTLTPVVVADLPPQLQDMIKPLPRPSRPALPNPFTRQVILNIVSYGILAYHTISAEQLLPVLFSMPESGQAPKLPFRFVGGFALPTKQIGFILSVQGFIQMFVTIFIFPMVNRKLGSIKTFRLVALSYPILYILVPYLTLIPVSLRTPGIYALLVWKVSAQALTFPSLAIMLANTAPSKKILGTLNGVSASAASLCRAFGPTLSGLVQSAGLSVGALGLPWWTNGLVAMIGSVLCLCMVEENRAYSKAEEANIKLDDEYDSYFDATNLESGNLADSLYSCEHNSVDALPIYQRTSESTTHQP
ncbi:hypothetical protein AAFC00_004191 [Neodothiora populina]|uniref:Major facilitator superfamily (MFS) profile domain-containing protein n=1 Tax=Neodothiora populina TaxID=2781224 RepID=A0ABR3PJ30_9PEZI